MATYRNSFYNATHGHDPEIYSTDAKPVEYKGYLLYQRIKGPIGRGCWDVVKDGVCIGQYAGPGGARAFVDRGCVRLGFESEAA
jgi:hypothetical protein